MRCNRLALIGTTSLLAFTLLLGSGCKTRGGSWISPWKSASANSTALPPPPGEELANNGTQSFELPSIDPKDLPPLATIEQRGIAEVAGPRQPSKPVAGLQTIYFDYNKAGLNDEAKTTLDADAQWLKAHGDMKVQVEGHCDERGTREYNMALGQRRADEVRQYLASKGIHPGRLSTISYGSERPLLEGHSESEYAKNRRVQFLSFE